MVSHTLSNSGSFFHIVVFNLLLHYRLPEGSTWGSLCVASPCFSCTYLALLGCYSKITATVSEEDTVRKECINSNHSKHVEDG